MNIKNVKRLRDAIKNAKPEAVSMGMYLSSTSLNAYEKGVDSIEKSTKINQRNSCGTAGCIAGWTCLEFADKDQKKMKWIDFLKEFESDYSRDDVDQGFFKKGREVLGLTVKQAQRLFLAEGKGWGSLRKKDWIGKKDSCFDNNYESKLGYTMDLEGEEGKKKILRQLNYMIKTGKV